MIGETAGWDLADRHQLGIEDAMLAAHGSVDVLSKHTPNQRRDAAVQQRHQSRVKQP